MYQSYDICWKIISDYTEESKKFKLAHQDFDRWINCIRRLERYQYEQTQTQCDDKREKDGLSNSV